MQTIRKTCPAIFRHAPYTWGVSSFFAHGQCCTFGPSPKGTLHSYFRVLQPIRKTCPAIFRHAPSPMGCFFFFCSMGSVVTSAPPLKGPSVATSASCRPYARRVLQFFGTPLTHGVFLLFLLYGQCRNFGPSPKGTLRSYFRVLQTIRKTCPAIFRHAPYTWGVSSFSALWAVS